MADVTVTLGARDAGLQAAMNRAQGAANNFKASLANMAAPLAALGALGGAFAAIKSSLDLGGRLSDISSQTGIAVADLAVLEQAFKNNGLAAEQVGPSVNRLQRAIVEAGQGSTASAEIFNRLGLSLAQLETQSPADQFRTVAAAIQGLQSPAARTAAAMEIFGRSGGKLLALFADSNAFSRAATQVGGLAGVMDANATSFDSISDSLAAASLKGQQLSASFTAALAPALERIAASLDQTDLTGLGQSLGTIASAAINLTTTLAGMIPQIVGVTVAFAAFRSGFAANVIASISRIGPVSTAAFAQVRIGMASINFTTFAAAGRAAFVSIGVAARGAAMAIRSAFIATGIGAIVAGITFAIEMLMTSMAKSAAATDALKASLQDSASAAQQLSDEIDQIATAAEKVAFGKRLEEEIERSRKKIEELQGDTTLKKDERAMGIEGLESQIASLERLRAANENITPEVLAGRQAERDRAAAIAESERQAASLNAELGKGKAALDKKIADSAFNQLGAQEQKDTTLSGVGLASTAAVDAELAALAAKREATFLTGEEAKRMEALLDARSKLVDIEKSINDERDRAAEQAARDQERAEAEARIAAEKAAANAELQKTLQLELAIAEARASKNTQEEAKLQYIKDYRDALERARQAGVENNEAFAIARRFADAEFAQRQEGGDTTGPRANNEPIFTSSLAKIGGGGGIALAGQNLENLAREQVTVLRDIRDALPAAEDQLDEASLERAIAPEPVQAPLPPPPLPPPPLLPPPPPPPILPPVMPSFDIPELNRGIDNKLDTGRLYGALEKDVISTAIYNEARLHSRFLKTIAEGITRLSPSATPLLS